MKSNINHISIANLKAESPEGLEPIVGQIREFLISSISETGGHIGANLGVVELSVALHYAFNSPNDAFIFDTGHIGYTHKVLTGRAEMFKTLNTYGGMNRFISRDESVHDFIEASHAGTSISIALGRALALRNAGKEDWTVAIIGDGALSEGIALEALNHASVEPNIRLLIVINDNGYAISPGFGAIHNYLQSRKTGSTESDSLFSSLGYKVLGPIDGHSIKALLAAFDEVKTSFEVCVIHLKTEKGKGLISAANHPFKMHFSFPFEAETGVSLWPPVGVTYQDVASSAINKCMEHDSKIVAITPSTLYATGLASIFEKYPTRCFDPGMEEQHAVSMAVGMALAGLRPILFYQSTFLQRAFDQLIHDVSFSNQDILILTVRSGFAGYDNPTHHGIYDFSYLRCLPNVQIFYPKDAQELYTITSIALTTLKGPLIIHMPYGSISDPGDLRTDLTMNVHEPDLITSGRDGVIITIGNKVASCLSAIELLESRGLSFGLINIRQLKPLQENYLLPLLKNVERVVTVEEGVLEGGFGSAISSFMHKNELDQELLQIGLPCAFIEAGSNDELSSKYGLDSNGIVGQILARWRPTI